MSFPLIPGSPLEIMTFEAGLTSVYQKIKQLAVILENSKTCLCAKLFPKKKDNKRSDTPITPPVLSLSQSTGKEQFKPIFQHLFYLLLLTRSHVATPETT